MKHSIKSESEILATNPNEAEMAMSSNAQSLQETSNYYQWNLDVFPIQNQKKILDLGCGPGLYYKTIMNHDPAVYFATDYSVNYLAQIEKLFQNNPNCKTSLLDLMSDSVPEALVGQQFDYAFCFDVLEHIQDDEKALKNIHKIMTATNTKQFFVRVPALQFIYGVNDEAIGHYRRYSTKSLARLLQKCSFRIEKIKYHNILGIFPWFIIGRVTRRSLAVSTGEGKLFDSLVPLLSFFERILPPPIGLSVYCICSPV